MAAASWSTRSRDRWLRLGRNAGIAWAASIMALVEQARNGHRRALALHGASLAAYALARSEPYPLDGFLAPAPGSLASRLDALERAGICAVEAGRSQDGLVALVAVERERHRTGIVAGHRLARDVEAAREVLGGPIPETPRDLASVFDWAAGSFTESASN